MNTENCTNVCQIFLNFYEIVILHAYIVINERFQEERIITSHY